MKAIIKITAACITAVFLFSSCKKDKNNSPTDTALSRIYENGKLITEFIYSPQKKVIQINYPDESTAYGPVDYTYTFEYDANGNMITEKIFKEAKLSAMIFYERDAAGRVIKHEYKALSGTDSGKVVSRVKYNYDINGRISKQSWVDLVTDKVYTTREMKYYSNGNLKSSATFYHYGVTPDLQWKTEYSPAGDTLPQNMAAFKTWPVNFSLPDFTASEKHHYSYYGAPAPVGESKEIFSNRKYNGKGYITEQMITVKNILPAAPSVVKEMQYEYVDL